jgi:hypothetical protein
VPAVPVPADGSGAVVRVPVAGAVAAAVGVTVVGDPAAGVASPEPQAATPRRAARATAAPVGDRWVRGIVGERMADSFALVRQVTAS